MALFPRWTNPLARTSVLLAAVLPAAALGGLWVLQRTPWVTRADTPVVQPVQFDHRHHVRDEGIDCRFCHTSVEHSPKAGIPSTQVCMGCHAQVWNKGAYLAPVREAWFTDRPIAWARVHDLPDFVYFNHAIHVNKGVGCVTCHGRVDEMPSVQQASPLTMGWCLDCHRDPVPHLRPREQVISTTWTPTEELVARGVLGEMPRFPTPEQLQSHARTVGEAVASQNAVHTRTSCSTCHR
ncbi:MAG: hypothetical protein RL653_763 [Pseudomonadota bacterium]|jgi:hypothetical protein